MHDILKRIYALLIPTLGIGILGRYLSRGTGIIQTHLGGYTRGIIAIIVILFLVFAVQFGIVKSAAKYMKLRGVIIGVMIIILGHYCLTNDVASQNFAGDSISLLGVVLLYSSLAGLTISKKAIAAQKAAQQVIIEV